MTEQINQLGNQMFIMVGGLLLAYGLTMTGILKWYLPARFKQQTDERQAQINALKADTEQQTTMWAGIKQVLDSHSAQTTASTRFIERMLDLSDRTTGELKGNREAIIGVVESVSDLSVQFSEMRSQIETVIDGVQKNRLLGQETADNVRSIKGSLDAFGQKLDRTVEVARHETKPIPAITNGAETPKIDS